MKKNLLLTAVLALALIPNLSACKNNHNTGSAQTTSVESALNSAADPDNWKPEVVNSLLAFVPENSPIVWTTTRQMAAHYADIEKQLKTIQKICAADPELKKYASMLDPAVLRDKYGVDLKYTEAVVYLTDQIVVLRLRVDDAKKFVAAVDPILTDSVVNDISNQDEIQKKKLTHKIDTHTGILYKKAQPVNNGQRGGKPQFELVDAAYLEGDKHLVTIAVPMIMADKSSKIFDDAYKLPKNPIKIASLGKLEKDDIYKGYFVFESFIDTVFSYDRMNRSRQSSPEMNAHIDSFIGEWKWILGNTPKIEISAAVSDNGKNSLSSTILVPDSDTRNTLKNVLGSMPKNGILPGAVSGSLHIQFAKIFDQLNRFSNIILKKLMNKEVACTYMQRVYAQLATVIKNPGMLPNIDKSQIEMLSALDSAGVSFTPGGKNTKGSDFQAFASFHKDNLSHAFMNTAQTIIKQRSMEKYRSAGITPPENIAGDTPLQITPDTPFTIALTPVGLNDITIQYNQTDCRIATSGYDIKALASPGTAQSDKYLSIKVSDFKKLSMLTDNPEVLNAFKTVSLDVAPTDRGITFNYNGQMNI